MDFGGDEPPRRPTAQSVTPVTHSGSTTIPPSTATGPYRAREIPAARRLRHRAHRRARRASPAGTRASRRDPPGSPPARRPLGGRLAPRPDQAAGIATFDGGQHHGGQHHGGQHHGGQDGGGTGSARGSDRMAAAGAAAMRGRSHGAG